MLHIGKVVLLLFAILILSQALDITNVIFFLNYNVYSYATWRHNFTRLISLSLFKNISKQNSSCSTVVQLCRLTLTNQFMKITHKHWFLQKKVYPLVCNSYILCCYYYITV